MEDFIGRYTLEEKDQELCDDVINWFNSDNCDRSPGLYFKNNRVCVNNVDKESIDTSLTMANAYTIDPLIKPLNFLWDGVCQYIKKYEELQFMNFTSAPFFNIQKYLPPTGGYKQWHCERNAIGTPQEPVNNRILVWMLYLNTVENGGGTEFRYLDHVEKAEKGKLLIWPPDFTHTHRGVISPSEEKYIMTGWYVLNK